MKLSELQEIIVSKFQIFWVLKLWKSKISVAQNFEHVAAFDLNWSQAEKSVCTKQFWFYDKSLCNIGSFNRSFILEGLIRGRFIMLSTMIQPCISHRAQPGSWWVPVTWWSHVKSSQVLDVLSTPISIALQSNTDLKSPRFLWNSINIQFKRFQSEIK